MKSYETMPLTPVKPFGVKRKTYFYGVAGSVLAAHVVVGAIVRVMPPEPEEPAEGLGVEMQIIERLVPDTVVESSAVRMLERDADEEHVELPVFDPVLDGSPVAPPEVEPLGPTETVLPEVVPEDPAPPVDPTPPEDEPAPTPTEATPEEASPPPAKKTPTPKPAASKSPPVKKKPTSQPKSRPPVKKSVPAPKPPEPKPEEIARAIPVEPPTSGRKGLLSKIRNKSNSSPAPSEKYVRASWRKRPPPYYPYEQRKRGIEGTAHVRVSIDSRGRITAARLVKSTGNAQLDQAALLSVKKGVMNPARRGDRAVASEMIVPFEFYD